MVDWALDPGTGDMYVADNKIAEVHDPLREKEQMLGVALRTHRGEWLYDNEHGLPFVEEILVKSPDLDALASRIRGFCLTLEYVTAVLFCQLELDRPNRQLYITLNVETDSGQTGPFTITIAL